ncbi:MAG: extracellular solute-binding protein [Nanoarchaeota archaeon]|nr:extracellular solute-binding protein [Nanoarchaeota archaeon]
MQREVIHDYERRLEWQYRQIRKARIPEENKEVLVAFDRFLVAEGLSLPRRAKLLQHCLLFNRSYLPGLFREATTDSIWDAVIKLESSKLAPWTKQGYKVAVRKLFKFVTWGNEALRRRDYPEIVAGIRIGVKRRDQVRVRTGDIRRAAACTGVQLRIEAIGLPYGEAFQRFIDPSSPLDIVVLDEPWLRAFGDAADGTLCANPPIPFSASVMVTAWNPEAFRLLQETTPVNTPITFDQMLKYAVECKESPHGMVISAQSTERLANMVLQSALAAGVSPIRADATVNPAATSNASELLKQSLPYPTRVSGADALRRVVQGRAGFTPTWLSNVAMLCGVDPRARALRIVPIAGGGVDGTWYLGVRHRPSVPPGLAGRVARLLAATCDINERFLLGAVDPGILTGKRELSGGDLGESLQLDPARLAWANRWQRHTNMEFMSWIDRQGGRLASAVLA